MNFKEALIAYLQGEKVECYDGRAWFEFGKDVFFSIRVEHLDRFGAGWEFRLATRTILVNGVEVPAPESEAPISGDCYYVPDPKADAFFSESTWADQVLDNSLLARGIVYLNKDNAIARAKAMLRAREQQ